MPGADLAPKRRGISAPPPAAKQICTAIGSQMVPIAVSGDAAGQQLLQEDGGVARGAAAGIVPDIGDHHRPGSRSKRRVHGLLLVDLRH